MHTTSRKALIWQAWWIVTVLMCAFFTAYAWRVHDFIASRLESQIKTLTVLTRSHVLQSFAEIDGSLRGVRFEFEISGPGIDESQLEASSMPDTINPLAPFRCMVLVNSVGDAYLHSPAQCDVPDLSAWTEDIQNSPRSPSTIFTTFVGASEAKNPRLVRAISLQYADGSFGGLAMALLDTEKILGQLSESGYGHVQQRFALTESSPIPNTQSMMQVHTPHGMAQLEMRLTYDRSELIREWLGSVLPPFVGLIAIFFILWRWAKALSEALAQQAKSDLMVERSKIENEIQAQFLANMNHELRTPMNGVLTAAELLSETSLQPHQQHLLELIRRSGKFLLNIVNDVLDIGKIRAGKLTLESTPFHVLEILEDVASIVAPLVHDKGLLLLLEFDVDTSVQLLGDKTRVQQIMLNLVSNAIKFTTQGYVACRFSLEPVINANAPQQVMCCLEVQDTGIGMDMHQAHWLFQPFQQADISISRRFGGTGLGLAIVSQLVHMMGGSIAVESNVNEGAKFRVQWPTQQVPTSVAAPDTALNSVVISFVLQPGVHQAPLKRSLHVHAKHLGLRCVDAASIGQAQWDAFHWVIMTNDSVNDLTTQTRPAGTSVIQLCTPSEVWQFKAQEATSQMLSLSCPLRRCDIQQALHTLVNPEPSLLVPQLPSLQKSGPLELRVLVAEDNVVNQVLIRQILVNLGCQVDISNNGQEALDFFTKKTYDVILMDCQMPIMDGFEATQHIRAQEASANSLRLRTSVVALTAMTLETDVQLCLNAGMDDYLSKPLDKTLLRQKLIDWSTHSASLTQ